MSTEPDTHPNRDLGELRERISTARYEIDEPRVAVCVLRRIGPLLLGRELTTRRPTRTV